MGPQEVKVCQRLDSGLSHRRIPHHMGKQTAVWVLTGLCPVRTGRCHGPRKHGPVIGKDLSAGDPVLEDRRSGIVRIVDHRIALHNEKVSQIDPHRQK